MTKYNFILTFLSVGQIPRYTEQKWTLKMQYISNLLSFNKLAGIQSQIFALLVSQALCILVKSMELELLIGLLIAKKYCPLSNQRRVVLSTAGLAGNQAEAFQW